MSSLSTPRVVAIDMDGTFLRTGFTYDRPRFERVRERMRDAGARIVVASGNQDAQLRSFFDDPEEFAYVSDNGAWVRAEGDGEVLFTARIQPDVARSVADILDAERAPYCACGPGMAWVPRHTGEEFERFIGLYYHQREVVDRVDAEGVHLFKFTLADDRGLPPHLAGAVTDVVGEGVVPVTSGHGSLDLNAPGVHKGTGLTVLLDRWGIPASEAAAFGDSGNDLEMLRLVGHPVAMGNALPAVKQVARTTVASNDADGVLDQLERWFG